jgi:glycerol-3-phosphate acyltransferase PlsX
MGGDHGPKVVVPGVAKALERHPDIRFTLFGLENECSPVLDKHPALREASTFVPCEVAVSMDDKPSQALRHGRYRRRCGAPSRR